MRVMIMELKNKDECDDNPAPLKGVNYFNLENNIHV